MRVGVILEFLLGKSYRKTLENNTYLDISIHPKKWTTNVTMSLWEEGNGVALVSLDKTHLNYDKFLPMRLAEVIAIYFINKQSSKVIGFDLITK